MALKTHCTDEHNLLHILESTAISVPSLSIISKNKKEKKTQSHI
jgi:hypothetical protein